MDILSIANAAVLTMFGCLLIWAAWTDVTRFIIPNIISLLLVGLYPVHVLLAGLPQGMWMIALGMAVVVFITGFVMFMMNVMGGGDVKLMSAVILWIGPAYMLPFFAATLAAAVVLALISAVRLAIKLENQQDSLSASPQSAMVSGVDAGPDGTARAHASTTGSERFRSRYQWLVNLRYVPLTKLNVPYGAAIAAGGMTFLVMSVMKA